MACYRPLDAYRRPGGGVQFSQKGSASVLPLRLPCGQCRGCRVDRAREWALRCAHEAQLHEDNCFITLTYDDDHLPDGWSLDVSHWQKFAKRMRKEMGPFRFLHCGEYGDKNARPHYHACIFGVDFSSDRELFRGGDTPLWVSQTLSKLWPSGFSTIGALNYSTASYVARYVTKKITGPFGAMVYAGRKPPYATMSRRPGLGSAWLEKFRSDVYPSDEVVLEGRVFRPPRFYDERLEAEELEVLKRERRRSVDMREQTEERLRVREQVAEAHDSLRKRGL